MSRSFDNSTGSYLANLSAVVSDVPFTVLAWVNLTSLTVSTAFAMSDKDTTNTTGRIQARLGVLNTGAAFMTCGDITNGSVTTSTGSLSAGTWYPILGVWAAANDRTIYAAGTSANSTTSRTLANLDNTHVGVFRYNDTVYIQPMNGKLAHVAVWNTALGSTDRTMLLDGANPLTVARTSLVQYWPLTANVSPETSLIGSFDLTVTGNATYSTDDPSVSRINPGPVRAVTSQSLRAATR